MGSDWKRTSMRGVLATGRLLRSMALGLYAALRMLARFLVQRAIPAGWRWLRGTAWPAVSRFYRWLPHRRAVAAGTAALAIVAAALLLWPAQESPAGAPAGPATLAFAPAEAPPGAPILLSDVPAAGGLHFEVRIGGHAVPSQRLADGRIQAHVPVNLGSDGWPVAPRGGQAIEVHDSGRLIAKSDGGLRILELERAPGTTARVQQSLRDIVAGYELVFETLPAQDADDMAHRRAVMAMLRGLVSDGDRSLAAVLAGDSPWLEGAALDLELTDALLASSGVAGHYAARAAVFQRPQPAGTGLPVSLSLPLAATGARCRPGGTAHQLACQMQAHGLITDLSQYFVKPTADAYADIVGTALGAMGVHPGVSDALDKGASRAMAAHQIISALLSVVNFTMEKIAPSLLPSVLAKFELEIHPTLIRKGDMTRSRLLVEAHNRPQTITANDMVDLVKSILGLPALNKPFERQVIKVGFFVIDLYMTALRRFGITPPPSMNPDVFTLPFRKWGPIEVDSDDLVTLFSYDASVLAPLEREMEWRGVGTGIARLRMMPRVGGRGQVLIDNTLCWGCVWSGGAFGTEMAEASEEVAVDVDFKAAEPRGRAPHSTALTWEVMRREDGAPVPCTIDFGDGSDPERIPDCSQTRRTTHEFLYTSRLEDGGAWKPKLRLDENGMESGTEVFTDWRFGGSPDAGQAPVEARFTWDVPWPSDRSAPACEFDPGDGSDIQHFDDCLADTSTTHTFERKGSFVPSLTLVHEGRRDSLTAPVSVAEEGTCDEDLLKATTWAGTVSYTHGRDVWHSKSHYRVQYTHTVNLSAEMPERTRRRFRDADYLVQYYSPLHSGSAKVRFALHDYSDGTLSSYRKFSGQGTLKAQEPDMVEEGSALTLILDARKCTFSFHLQTEVQGSGERWSRMTGKEDYTGYRWINTVRHTGAITSSRSISGSEAIPVLSRSRIEDNGIDTPSWLAELDTVSRAMGGGTMGTATVSWSFHPVD